MQLTRIFYKIVVLYWRLQILRNKAEEAHFFSKQDVGYWLVNKREEAHF